MTDAPRPGLDCRACMGPIAGADRRCQACGLRDLLTGPQDTQTPKALPAGGAPGPPPGPAGPPAPMTAKREDLDALEKHLIDSIDDLDAVYAAAEKVFSSWRLARGARLEFRHVRHFQESLRSILDIVQTAKGEPMRWTVTDNATALVAGAWRLTVDHGGGPIGAGAPGMWSLFRDGQWRGDYASEAAAKAMAESSDLGRTESPGKVPRDGGGP